jgi:nucleotide-binding universal stress UspA family protein
LRAVKLVGHDGSRDAETAFEDALDLAALAHARLSVVSVASLPEPPTEVETQAAIDLATRHYEKLFETLRARPRSDRCPFRRTSSSAIPPIRF